MKAEEVRIGNLVSYSDYGACQITKIDAEGFCSIIPPNFSGDIGKLVSEVEPIQLTEE